MVLLFGCGVKKGYVVGDYGKQPLCGEVVGPIESADSSLDERAMLGLWWQKDSMQITLNHGRRLKAARAKGDTLYLYETLRDTMDVATRQYTFYIPQQELYIIKYNDSLVYPIMPATEKCEYPLNIKSTLNKRLQIVKKEVPQYQENEYRYKGSATNSYPDADEKSIAGTYYWGYYIEPFLQKMQLDTTIAMKITPDGVCKEYRNDTLVNCGIIRRKQRIKGYVMHTDAPYQVLMTDSREINGHIHPIGDMWQYLREGERLPAGEYFCDALYYMTEFRLFPARIISLPHTKSLITLGNILICNGEIYGWGKKSGYHIYK